MSKTSILLSFLFLTGCPDPIESGTNTNTTNADDPATINGNGPAKQENDPNAARLNLKPGEGLTISGTFQYGGTATGSKRVDVQKYREGSAPSLVHTLEISDDNSFSFQVPADYGKILITGFIDKAGNGPTADDPQGRLSLEIAAEAMSDVVLEVSDDYTPPEIPGGGAPEKNQPPPGEAPQEGGQPPANGPAGQAPQGQPPEGQAPEGQAPEGVAPANGQPGDQNQANPPKEDGNTPQQQDGPPADN